MSVGKVWEKWVPIFIEEIRKEMDKAPAVSPVHKEDHVLRVWERSKGLCERLGGDMEVMAAAALLHDLGRHYGLEIHGGKSAELARPILERHGFPKEKITKALQAIAQHDYNFPAEKRILIESKILYDCDKMDAFGVIGVYRHVLFVEKGRMKLEEVLPALEKRFEGLSFQESKEMAKGDYEYIAKFFVQLEKEIQ